MKSIRLQNQVISSLFIFFEMVFSCATATECPAIPPVPVPAPEDVKFQNAWQSVDEPSEARYAKKNYEDPAYGTGYLDVVNVKEFYYDWAKHIVLPIWKKPDKDKFYGWILAGRIHPDNGAIPFPLTGAGLVETGYETTNFIVYEITNDGWLRIRLKPGAKGEVWTHTCHLDYGNAKLAYKSWRIFLSKHGDWLHFRSQIPHSLREHPDVNSSRITLIGLDHKLILKEIKDDWMRVIVEQPDLTCSSLEMQEEKNVLVHEGWVKWRDEKIGPWVWVYTRGC